MRRETTVGNALERGEGQGIVKMVYSASPQHPALVELARAGNFRAIAHWLNQVLMPYGMRAFVGSARPGCLKILVELHPDLKQDEGLNEPWQDTLVRFVCHRIWKLNSSLIEGVRVAARFGDDRSILWERSVRIATPARRNRQQQSHQLRTQIRQTARRKAQLKTMRVLLMSGSTVSAFVIGAIVAYVKSPVDQSNAVPSPQASPGTPRSAIVQAALESVPVVKHNQVANPKDPTINLLFGGDVTLSDAFSDTVGKDYKWAFAELDEYREADLAMVNLENPLTTASTPMAGKQFNFKADPEAVQVLKEGGIDLVTLANNHTMDFETPGLLETMSTLEKAGILHLGAGRNITEARRPEVIDVKGQRIAYLGYFGEDFAATDQTAGTSPILEDRIAQDIKALRAQVDWVIVNYHWGQENATHPADWQTKLARFTIDQGADLVVGHHPHVLQGAEVYKGRPIAYSLGNFIFGGNSRSDYDTAVLKVAVKDKKMKVEFLPVEVQKYQAKVAKGDRADAILQQLADLSAGFAQPLKSPMVLDTSKPAVEPPSASPAVQPSPQPSPSSTPMNEPIVPPAEAPSDLATPSPAPIPEASPPAAPPIDPTQLVPADPATETTIPSSSTTFPERVVPTPPQDSPADMAPMPEANPSPAASPEPSLAPASEPAPSPTTSTPAPQENSESGSFTSSPNRTPFKPAVPQNSEGGQSAPDAAATPAPAPPESSPLPTNSPSPEATAPSEGDRMTAVPAAEADTQLDRSRLVAQENAETAQPNVALMAANLW